MRPDSRASSPAVRWRPERAAIGFFCIGANQELFLTAGSSLPPFREPGRGPRRRGAGSAQYVSGPASRRVVHRVWIWLQLRIVSNWG
jgi:hypothetical protein